MTADWFVAGLIAQALTETMHVFARENAHLRVVAQKVECPYGFRSASGACTLGYPGCACMDDVIILAQFEPAVRKQRAMDHVMRRADALERRLCNARERIDIAARNYRSLASGFQMNREPMKAAAVTAMADLLEAPL